MKKNDFIGDNNLDAYNKEREKKRKILEQIKTKNIGDNHIILRELFNNGICEKLSLTDLINAGFKDDNAIYSYPSTINILYGGVVFHEKTHYESFDLECIDMRNNTFNIIKTENSQLKAKLLNSIRDIKILIEGYKDAATDCRFSGNNTMEVYYISAKYKTENELRILEIKLEEESNSDKATKLEHKITKEELQSLIKDLEMQNESNPNEGLQKRIKALQIVLKYKK